MERSRASKRARRVPIRAAALLAGVLSALTVVATPLAGAQTATTRAVQAVVIAAGSDGTAHVVTAYGAEGTPLRSHHTTSPVLDVSVCPGSAHAAVLTTQSVEVISIATMQPKNSDSRSLVSRELRPSTGVSLDKVRCLDAGGDRLLVAGATPRSASVTLVTPGSIDDVWQAGLVSFDVSPNGRLLYVAGVGGSLVEIDLSTLKSRRLGTDGLALYNLTLNPTGRLIAGVQTTGPSGSGPAHAIVIDTVTNSIVTRLEPEPVPTGASGTTIHWFDDGRLGLRPTGGLLDAYDPSYLLIARAERLFGYPAENLDSTVYSVHGHLVLQTTFGVGGVTVFITAEHELTTLALLDPPVDVKLLPEVPRTPIPEVAPGRVSSAATAADGETIARSAPLTGSIGPAIDYELTEIDEPLGLVAAETTTSVGLPLLLFVMLGVGGATVFLVARHRLRRS